ncbi:MAG: hypothetical protein ABMA64_35365 [Myxococcota bacterium]
MRIGAMLALWGAAGCDGYSPVFTGSPVWQMFPFDGEREWNYVSTDQTIPYKMVVTSDGVAEVIGGENVYTLRYTKGCVAASEECVDGDLLYQLRWASNATYGTFVYAFDAGDGFQDFDPPVQITLDTMKRDDVVETSTAGANWSSTMRGIEPCPIRMSANWPECGAFSVETDGGDGFPLAGDWWAVAGNGVAAFQLPSDTGQWQLSSFECAGECDGTW